MENDSVKQLLKCLIILYKEKNGGIVVLAKIIKKWSDGSVSIAVEAGKDDMNKEGTHVHVYKRGRRTDSRIPGNNRDLDDKDYDIAEKLYYENLREIESLCNAVIRGEYDH